MRASLPFVIDWMKQIDAWHEFKFSDRQLQTISPEFQQYGETVLNNTLNLVKTMDRKPSPAKLMSMCKEQQAQLKEKHPDMSLGDMNKQLGVLWKGLTDEQKSQYTSVSA